MGLFGGLAGANEWRTGSIVLATLGFGALVAIVVHSTYGHFASRRSGAHRVHPNLVFGEPRLSSEKTYRLGTFEGAPFRTILLPVSNDDHESPSVAAHGLRADITFTPSGSSSAVLRIPGRWENRTPQPQKAFGDDLTRLDRITLDEGESDDLGIAVQHRGDADLYAFGNRSYEMPLQHRVPDFRHPELRLVGSEAFDVDVVLRADEVVQPLKKTFALKRVNGQWLPSPPDSPEPEYDDDRAYWREQILSRGYDLIGRAEETREDAPGFATLKGDVHRYVRKMRGIASGKFPARSRRLLPEDEEEKLLAQGGCGDFVTILRTYVSLFADDS
jgi:hypothetical protein